MLFKKLLPYALAACFAFPLWQSSAAAQTIETRGRQIAQIIDTPNLSVPNDDLVIISLASAEDVKAANPFDSKGEAGLRFRQLITAAIEQRLGARYMWGAAGPSAFDCSGFVWSIFQSAGIDFERGSARALWVRFGAPAPEDKFKFGTLVFFSGLAHVGIVADEHGFYHASRRHGVVYSPFNDYWVSRIDGFREVPIAAPQTTD